MVLPSVDVNVGFPPPAEQDNEKKQDKVPEEHTSNTNSIDRETWLQLRKGRLTASKLGVLLGFTGSLADFARALADLTWGVHPVYEVQKKILATIQEAGEEHPKSTAMLWGTAMEAPAVELWVCHMRERFGNQHFIHTYPVELKYHWEDKFYAATPDVTFTGLAPGAELMLAEFKCPYSRALPKRVEDIPVPYLLQVIHQMYVTGASATVLVYTWFHPEAPSCSELAAQAQWFIRAPPPDLYQKLVLLYVRERLLGPQTPGQPSLRQLRKEVPRDLFAQWARSWVQGHDSLLSVGPFSRIPSAVPSAPLPRPETGLAPAWQLLSHSLRGRPRELPDATHQTDAPAEPEPGPPSPDTSRRVVLARTHVWRTACALMESRLGTNV